MAIAYLQTNLQNSAEAVLVARQAEIEALREGNQNLKAYLIQRRAQSQQTETIYAAEIAACEQELLRQVRALGQLQFTPGLPPIAHLETKGKELLEKKITPSASLPQYEALAAKIAELHTYCGQLGQQIGVDSQQAIWEVVPVRAGDRPRPSLHVLGIGSVWDKAVRARAARERQPCVIPTPQENALYTQGQQIMGRMNATLWQ